MSCCCPPLRLMHIYPCFADVKGNSPPLFWIHIYPCFAAVRSCFRCIFTHVLLLWQEIPRPCFRCIFIHVLFRQQAIILTSPAVFLTLKECMFSCCDRQLHIGVHICQYLNAYACVYILNFLRNTECTFHQLGWSASSLWETLPMWNPVVESFREGLFPMTSRSCLSSYTILVLAPPKTDFLCLFKDPF